MAEMNWELIFRYVPEVVLVVLFMAYQERADTRRAQAAKELEDKRIQSAKDNHAEWRTFLKERDAVYNASQDRLANEIKTIANNLAAQNALMIAHDTQSSPAYASIARIRERLAQAGIGDIEDSSIPGVNK